MKFYIPIGQAGFGRLLDYLGHSIVSTMGTADAVLFTGGADVDPRLYGERAHPETRFDFRRDAADRAVWEWSRKLEKYCLGVCRGAQFIHVMSGGSLHQHVEGHLGNHTMYTNDGREYDVTSTHHQMINNQGEGELVAWADQGAVSEGDETEVMWYPQTDSLAVQFHPEYHRLDDAAVTYFKELLETYF